VEAIVIILHVSYIVSGLKIKLHKRKLAGFGVDFNTVEDMEMVTGCDAMKLPFEYLGLKVGENMSSINAWDEIILKVTKKLSTSKVKTLSVGGPLTLLKSVLGTLPNYYMSMFKLQ